MTDKMLLCEENRNGKHEQNKKLGNNFDISKRRRMIDFV